MTPRRVSLMAGLLGLVALVPVLLANPTALGPGSEGGTFATDVTAVKPADVPFDQKLGDSIPLDLRFTDHHGQEVRLRDLVGDVPVVFVMAYYECPMLCGLVEKGLIESLNALTLDLGTEYRVVTVSIDPAETVALAARKQAAAVKMVERDVDKDAWSFLVGDETAIARLAAALGFHYRYDERSGEWAHPAGIVVVTPAGQISRYFYGIDYPARDLRLGLVEAAEGAVGDLADQFLLLCYGYDPATGQYSITIMKVLRLAGVVTILMMILLIAGLSRGSRRDDTGEGATRV